MEKDMSFLEHLEELRWHVVRAVLAILICGTVIFFFKEFIFENILFGPSRPDFITYEILCSISQYVASSDALCISEIPIQVINRKVAGQFYAYMWAYLLAGIIIGFPYVMWEIWRFISPGLSPKERKFGAAFILSAFVLFIIGLAFGYFMITPLSLRFFTTISLSSELANQPDLSDYISMLAITNISCAIIFELPLIIFMLVKTGIMTTASLKKYRKHAIVIIMILSAFITPPDFLSQLLVGIPVIALYEFSILVAKLLEKRNKNELSRRV